MEIRETTLRDAVKVFEGLPEGTRAELIDGEIVMMASPSEEHQDVQRELLIELGVYLRGKACKVWSEYEAQLYEHNRKIVFRPDVMVVCDPSKRRGFRIIGAPDLVIEIISLSTAGRDAITKLNHYRDAGVKEYWLVHPDKKLVQVFIWNDGKIIYNAYTVPDLIPVSIFDDLKIDLSLIFPQETEPSATN